MSITSGLAITIIVVGFLLAIIRERRIGDPVIRGTIRVSVPRTGFGLFYEGTIGYICSAGVITAGIIMLLLTK